MRAAAMRSLRGEDEPQPLGPAQWDWQSVRNVLIVRLRSIGDTVLTTPSLFALKRFVPHARVDILLEDWVAPVLEGSPYVDNVITLERRSTLRARPSLGNLRATDTTSLTIYTAAPRRHCLRVLLAPGIAWVTRTINTRVCITISLLRQRHFGERASTHSSNNNSHCSVGQVSRLAIVRQPDWG